MTDMPGVRKSRLPEQPTGSPPQPEGSAPNGEPAFLVVGKLRHTHGVRGEILLDVITDFPERLQPGMTVFVGEQHRPERIRSRRMHGQGLLLSFEGYTTPESMSALRNTLVYVPTAGRPPLPEGEYYHHQVLGLRVVSDEGGELGRISEILSTAAHDVYVIRSEGGAEILLPATDEVIIEIDLTQGLLRAHLLPGLI
jgi:16S rRNA processing protein RimM